MQYCQHVGQADVYTKFAASTADATTAMAPNAGGGLPHAAALSVATASIATAVAAVTVPLALMFQVHKLCIASAQQPLLSPLLLLLL
jgi:hypothetical protein